MSVDIADFTFDKIEGPFGSSSFSFSLTFIIEGLLAPSMAAFEGLLPASFIAIEGLLPASMAAFEDLLSMAAFEDLLSMAAFEDLLSMDAFEGLLSMDAFEGLLSMDAFKGLLSMAAIEGLLAASTGIEGLLPASMAAIEGLLAPSAYLVDSCGEASDLERFDLEDAVRLLFDFLRSDLEDAPRLLLGFLRTVLVVFMMRGPDGNWSGNCVLDACGPPSNSGWDLCNDAGEPGPPGWPPFGRFLFFFRRFFFPGPPGGPPDWPGIPPGGVFFFFFLLLFFPFLISPPAPTLDLDILRPMEV